MLQPTMCLCVTNLWQLTDTNWAAARPVEKSSTAALKPPDPVPIMTEVQTTETMTHSNPYAQQMIAQGRDLSKAPAPKADYPRTIHGRTFETEEDYLDAIYDMLNGM